MGSNKNGGHLNIKNENLKVVMLIYNFFPIIGGAERQVSLLARSLLDVGTKTFVLTARLKNLPEKETINGIEVIRTKVISEDNKIAGFTYAFSLFFALLRNKNKFKIIHSHIISLHAVIAVIFAKLFGKKTIVEVRGGGHKGNIWTLKQSFMSWLKIAILKKADCFVSISSEITDELLDFGANKEKIVFIPNGVDTDTYKPAIDKASARKKIGAKEAITACYTGRLIKEKNILLLFRACGRLLKEGLVFNLLVVGDGNQKDELIKFVKENGLQERVIFTGNVSNVNDYIAASDIGILPSLAEGLSNSMLEMMSAGIPVISSNVGGAPDVIKHNQNGLLFESNDEEKLYINLKALIEDKNKRELLGKNARDTINEKYSIQKITNDYINLYKSL